LKIKEEVEAEEEVGWGPGLLTAKRKRKAFMSFIVVTA
jgi:hypothetical protein